MCAILKSCKQTDFCLQVVMTITSGANAKNCTMKCQIQDELLFLAEFQIHYSHWLCTVIGCDQYIQFTVGFATQPKSVLSTVKLQSLAVQTTVIDFEEYSYSLSDVFGCNMCSKITVGFATQLKAVPSTVKIFAV